MVAAEPGPQGLRLVKTAAAVAAECGLPLHLVYVAPGDSKGADADSFMAEAKAAVQTLNIPVQTEIRRGKAFTEILAAATACQADLLVIASRSDSHIGRATIGGVAQKIIGLSEMPVMALNLSSVSYTHLLKTARHA